MGNRAVICFGKKPSDVSIYLHWNGGPDKVLAILEVCRRRGYRSPGADPSYAMARLIGVFHEYMDDGLSLGVQKLSEADVDNFDNGAYLVAGDWEVKERFGKGNDGVKSFNELSPRDKEVYLVVVDGLKKEPVHA